MKTVAATDLVGLANRIFDGTVKVPGGRSARAAAVVARQALEESVDQRCADLIDGMRRASMRSKIILLRQLGDPEMGRKAQVAWAGLSNACHHHAYELQPPAAEVRSLLKLVAEIAEP
jgi:hypothetical protein